MQFGRLAKNWLPPAFLAIVALVAWRAANQADFGASSAQEVTYEATLQSPLLTARRLPLTLRAPVNDEMVFDEVNEILDLTPDEQVCLTVRNGDRILGTPRQVEGGLIPASNQKLLTTYAGLELLGSDFTYNTRVATSVPVVDGVIDGDLYFIGDGDPFLYTEEWLSQYEVVDARSHTRLEGLADQIVALGVTTITGSVVGDESLFDAERYGPWDNRLIVQRQSGPLSALTVNEGFVDWPAVFPESFRTRRETSNPPEHAASILNQLLQERGVTVAGAPTSGIAPLGVTQLAFIQSPSLLDTVTHINTHSSNLGAEMLLKRIGFAQNGLGTTAAGAAAVTDFLTEEGIPMDDVAVFDGSGLSEDDRLTCRAVAEILVRNGPDSELGRSLSVSGGVGSMGPRLVDSPAEGMVLAKTGTLRGVHALSGYVLSAVPTPSETYVTFSYILNDDEVIDEEVVRANQIPFATALTGYPGGPTVDQLSPLAAAVG